MLFNILREDRKIYDVQIFSLIDAKSEVSEVLEVLHSFTFDKLDKIFVEHYEGITGNKTRKVDNAVIFLANELTKIKQLPEKQRLKTT